MAIAATSVFLALLGTLSLASANPIPMISELDGLVLTAKILYEELVKVAAKESISEPCICSPIPEVNFPETLGSDARSLAPAGATNPQPNAFAPGEHVITGYTGNNLFNYENGGDNMRISGK